MRPLADPQQATPTEQHVQVEAVHVVAHHDVRVQLVHLVGGDGPVSGRREDGNGGLD